MTTNHSTAQGTTAGRLAVRARPQPTWQYTAPVTSAQQQARDAFDLDAAVAALPPAGKEPFDHDPYGTAGVRLRTSLKADVSDALLREFARETLGAQRCSAQYIDALRVVLGNQQHADRFRYLLELNQRVSFASPNVMRTIIDQMQAAGITRGVTVKPGKGLKQVVQCYGIRRRQLTDRTQEHVVAATLQRTYRESDADDDEWITSVPPLPKRYYESKEFHKDIKIKARDIPF